MKKKYITLNQKLQLEPIGEQEYYETSHKQKHEWKFAYSRQEEESLFKVKIIKHVKHLDIKVFEEVYKCAIKRHESLRTNFVTLNGELMQKISQWDPRRFLIHYFDLRKNNLNDYENWIRSEDSRMVNYETEPLITVQVFRTSNEMYVLALFIEHIIFDAISSIILVEELESLYSQLIAGDKIQAVPNEIQLKDYTAWRNALVNRKSNKEYWEDRIKDNQYTFDFKKFYKIYGEKNKYKKEKLKGKYIFYINKELMTKLSHTAKTFKVSLAGFLIGAFIILLSRIFDQKHILVSIMSMGREKEGTKHLLANCTDFVFLFINICDSSSLRIMIQQIYINFFNSYNYPWSDTGDWPFNNKDLFKINYLPRAKHKKITDFEKIHQEVRSPGITSTSYMQFLECSDGIELLCKYSSFYYSPDMIEFICDKYLSLLNNVVKYPDKILKDIKHF